MLVPFLVFALAGCVSTRRPPPPEKLSAGEVLGTFLLMTAISGKADGDFIETVYPFRSQMVTFAVVGFHREHGTWPSGKDEVMAFVESSPANPPMPAGALEGLQMHVQDDGGVVYSTAEDRQRGREFTISAEHHVTMTVPSNLFASARATEIPPAGGSTISFDWTDAILQTLMQLELRKR